MTEGTFFACFWIETGNLIEKEGRREMTGRNKTTKKGQQKGKKRNRKRQERNLEEQFFFWPNPKNEPSPIERRRERSTSPVTEKKRT